MANKLILPETHKPFPNEHDWKKVNNVWDNKNIDRKNIFIWRNEKGQIVLVTYRINSPNPEEEKSVMPITYCLPENPEDVQRYEYRRNWGGWDFDKPLFNYDQLVNDPKKEIIIVEGEKTVTAASTHYPSYNCTTFNHGCNGWPQADLGILKNKKIILFPDNDSAGKRAFHEFGYYLKTNLGCKVKMIELPSTFPRKWDVADDFTVECSGYTYESLLDLAKDYTDPIFFNNVLQDAQNKRYIIIEDSNGKSFFDTYQKRVLHKDSINLFYNADPNMKDGKIKNPIRIIAQHSPERVRSTAFQRSSASVITIDGDKYLNTFQPVKFKPLTEKQISSLAFLVKPWTDHLKMIFNHSEKLTEYFESTIAHDLQHPNYNRTWAWLLHSTQGLGKGIIFEVIKKLNGPKNVAHVSNRMLTDTYRGYLRYTDMIMCTEVRITGREKGQKMDSLKELISETTHPIEEKFVNTQYHQGHFKVYLSSNDPVAIAPEATDRRFAINSTLKTKAELLEERPNYFVDIWKWINNDSNINILHHYYKNIYEISKAFNPHEPILTVAKKNILEASRGQVFLDLDAAFENPWMNRVGCRAFQYDIVNARDILLQIRRDEDSEASGEGAYKRIFENLTENAIQHWLRTINAKPIKNGQPVRLQGGQGRKRFWAIRNQKYWTGLDNLEKFREHLDGKYNAPSDLFEYKEQKESEAV